MHTPSRCLVAAALHWQAMALSLHAIFSVLVLLDQLSQTDSVQFTRQRSMNAHFFAGRKHGAKIPDIHTVHKVSIIKAFHDGIFVSIPGYDVDGLVHHSQISRNLMLPADMPKAERYHKINDLIGDIDYDVYAKTVYVCDEKDYTKCECSLKMVRFIALWSASVKHAHDGNEFHTAVLTLVFMLQQQIMLEVLQLLHRVCCALVISPTCLCRSACVSHFLLQHGTECCQRCRCLSATGAIWIRITRCGSTTW